MSTRPAAALAAALLLSSTASFGQGTQLPMVKTPNEGPARTYLCSLEEGLEASVQAAASSLGLEVTRAPDGTVFIASPTSWSVPVDGISFTRTFVVRVRTQLWLDKDARATLFVVETPEVDDSKTVWLDGKSAKASAALRAHSKSR